jgi:anaphase-promoting complex subunit 4
VIRIEHHPYLSTVLLLVELERDKSVHLVGLDMTFIPQTGRNLSLVARKATQLENLLRYLLQIQLQLSAEVKAAFDLPARFLRNINESLAENDAESDFAFAAHHLVITGECEPRLKEWLVDEVGDRGLKRWEKAVGDCLEVVRRMTSECLLPALERTQVVLSRMDGLARFADTRERLGLDEMTIKQVRETVDVLSIVAEDLLLDVGCEIREFSSFMKWLKWECEIEAMEETSERAEEARETWNGEQELRAVLDYVGGAMNQTRLRRYIDTAMPSTAGDQKAGATPLEDTEAGFYVDCMKERTKASGNVPRLGDLLQRLKKQCNVVFEEIAETFRKSCLVRHLGQLPQDLNGVQLDTRIVPDGADPNRGVYRLYALSLDQRQKKVLQETVITLRQEGKSFKATTQSTTLPQLPETNEILDAKFVDDSGFLVLASTDHDIRIYERSIDASSNKSGNWEERHVFVNGTMDAGMKPSQLEINGRVGRRVVTVVDQAGLGFSILDLDAIDGEGEGDQPQSEDEAEDQIMTG